MYMTNLRPFPVFVGESSTLILYSFIRIILNILQLRDKNIVLEIKDIVLVYKYIKFNCNFIIPTMDGKNTTYIV